MRVPLVRGVANAAAIACGFAVIIPAMHLATYFLRCHLSFGSQSGGCQEHPLVFASIAICGGVLGILISFALRARFAAYWWAVISVCNTVGSVWFLRSSIVDSPRYQAMQSAMLMAATLGVILAAIMRETPRAETDHRPVRDVDDSAGAPGSILSWHRITAHLIAGTISFAMAASLILMRGRHLDAENVNYYALLGSAMLAAILAGQIRRHWSRLSAQGNINRV